MPYDTLPLDLPMGHFYQHLGTHSSTDENEEKRTELEPILCANRQGDGRARTHQAAERAPYLGNVPRRDVDAERKGDGMSVGVVPGKGVSLEVVTTCSPERERTDVICSTTDDREEVSSEDLLAYRHGHWR
ncbi:hypothetical protein BJ912DRAFT_1043421 [Pholiota molesta]|nr:hypothetical protein BJ912DRAFT_1043421 [Pholiota molesta]